MSLCRLGFLWLFKAFLDKSFLSISSCKLLTEVYFLNIHKFCSFGPLGLINHCSFPTFHVCQQSQNIPIPSSTSREKKKTTTFNLLASWESISKVENFQVFRLVPTNILWKNFIIPFLILTTIVKCFHGIFHFSEPSPPPGPFRKAG